MTPERVVALVVSLSPVLAILGTIVVAVITRPLRAKPHQVKPTDQQPALGVTVDDDHADDAIEALTESRDAWKARALDAEPRLRQANTTLAEHGLPTA